jgi:hypothetical protein
MGFLKKLGVFGGTLVGGAIGGTISVVGQVVGSEFIEEIGEGVFKSTVATGKILGETASGAFDLVDGIITSDKSKIDEGFEDIGGAAMKTVKGIGNGIGNTIKSGGSLIVGALEGDGDKFSESAKSLIKNVAIGTFAIGVIDVLDGGLIDSYDADDVAMDSDVEVHDVKPHEVSEYYRSDGTPVDGYFRDGDGNTHNDLTQEHGGGYIRSNPDGNLNNNLG